MNKDNAKDFLPLVQALAAGKAIQFKTSVSRKFAWIDFLGSEISFGGDVTNYRIKPEKKCGWMNLYAVEMSGEKYAYGSAVYASRVGADAANGLLIEAGRIACIPVEFEEGEGL